MGMEDDLFEALKYANLGGKMPQNKMIQSLIKTVQVGALRKLRDELDRMISKLSKQEAGPTGGVPNPYDVLGVTPESSQEEVTKAYREKAAEVHPDKGGTHQQMILVNAAYEAIKRLHSWG